MIDNLTDNFRGYATLLRKIKQRMLIAQQRVIYAANEEMLQQRYRRLGYENPTTVIGGFEEE